MTFSLQVTYVFGCLTYYRTLILNGRCEFEHRLRLEERVFIAILRVTINEFAWRLHV